MALAWRPNMAVGQAAIDADHHRLLDLINAVETALDGGPPDGLMRTLAHLADYTREHFDREESLMSCVGYARLAEHRQQHRELRGRLGELIVAFGAAGADEVSEVDRHRLVELLRNWLLDHVFREDMLLKPVWQDAALPPG